MGGLKVGGVIMLATGIGLVYLGFRAPDGRAGLWGAGFPIALASLVFFGLSRSIGGGAERIRKKGGIQGTARVLSVNDTGITINELTAIFKIEAEITIPTRPAYQGSFRIPVGRTQWGSIQPGVTLPVIVDPRNPSKISYDDSARTDLDQTPSMADLATAVAAIPTSAPASAGVQTMSTRDIVSRGVQATGTVLGAQLTGRTAGELAPSMGLAASEADDPVAVVQLHVEPAGAGAAPFDASAVLRIPDGKQSLLAPGSRVPVAYLPDNPAATATIDWDRA